MVGEYFARYEARVQEYPYISNRCDAAAGKYARSRRYTMISIYFVKTLNHSFGYASQVFPRISRHIVPFNIIGGSDLISSPIHFKTS